jgi:hypothetical protein
VNDEMQADAPLVDISDVRKHAESTTVDVTEGRTRLWSRSIDDDDDVQELSKRCDELSQRQGSEDEEEGEEIADHALERSGFLLKKSGALSGWRRRYFVLPPYGTLLWYKSEHDTKPTGYVALAECTVLGPDATPGAPWPPKRLEATLKGVDGYSLVLAAAHKEYVLVAEDAAARVAWLRALRHNAALPPMPGVGGPTGDSADPEAAKAAKRSMLGGVVLRAEKAMASRAVTSDLGKKLLTSFLLPETLTLVQATRNLMAKDTTLPAKRALDFENTILKTTVKIVILMQHGLLTGRELGPLSREVDALCLEVVRTHHAARGMADVPEEEARHTELVRRLGDVDGMCLRVLGGLLSPKNMAALQALTAHVRDPRTIERLLSEPCFTADVDAVAEALRVVYGLAYGGAQLSGAGGASGSEYERTCTLASAPGSPKKFRATVAGLPSGSVIFCTLPCCGARISFSVAKPTRSVVFPQTASCVKTCGR